MNKTDIISLVADKTDMKKTEVTKVIESMIDVIKAGIKSGEKVSIRGFVSFDLREMKAKQGRNPRNPEEVIDIPASTIPKAKIASSFKEEVKEYYR